MLKGKGTSRWLQATMAFVLLLGTISPTGVVLAEPLKEIGKQVQTEKIEEEAVLDSENETVLDESEDTDLEQTLDSTEVPPLEKESEVTTEKEPMLSESQKTEEKQAVSALAEDPTEKSEKEKSDATKVSQKQVTILGTSDVHGNVWDWSYEDNRVADLGFARIGTIVKQVKGQNPNTLVIDAGDNLQGTLLTDDLYSTDKELLKEKHPVTQAMNTIGYDAMVLGNHEFNFGLDLITKLKNEASFPILSANIYNKSDGSNFVKAYTTKNVDGVKVAILGLTVPHVPKWDGDKVSSLDFKPLKEEAQKQVKIIEQQEKPDVIVAAMHTGLDNEDPSAAARNVITEVPEIDAFILGHDHREFAEKLADNTGKLKPVGAVKDTGSGVLRIDLNLEKDETDKKWQVKESAPTIISSKSVTGDGEVKAATQAAHDTTKEYVTGVIGEAVADFLPEAEIPGIPEAQLQPTAMISLINNVQRQVTGSDLAAAALFKADSQLNKGPIKFSDIFNIYKYPNTLVGANMNGKQLRTFLEKQAAYYQQYETGDVTIAFNPNIRVYNYDIVSGIQYKMDISKPEGSRIAELLFKGKPVTDNQTFKIAMNNYRFEGMVKEGLVDATPYFESDPDTLRGEIVNYIKNQPNGVIDPAKEIEKSFEIIGADLSHPLRDYVISQIKAGTKGFEIESSSDGRTPNVKKFNVDQLIAEGLIPEDMLEGLEGNTVKIMHTNDMHGRLEYMEDKYSPSIGMGRVKTFKDQQKPTLLVDAGDAMQGLPISNYSKGMDMVKAMNAVGYDGMTLGNHEFDFGLETALAYKDKLNFPIVSANVYKDGKRPFEPYALVNKKVEGKTQRFALIGLTTPETSVKTHPNNVKGVTFKKPAPVAIKTVKEIGNKADYFVFMTHLGFDETTVEDETSTYLAKQLAKNFPDKKIFIADGHSHSELPNGHIEQHVLMGQTGNHLNNVGMMTADYSEKLTKLSAKLHSFAELKGLEPNPEVEAIVQEAKENFDEDMSQVVLANNPIVFNGERENARTRETNLGNIVGDALYHYGQTGFNQPSDFAIMNGGGLRQSIQKGKVTKGDIVGVMPFGNTISQVKVTGKEIYEMFEHSLRSIHEKDEEGQVILDENGVPKLGANGGFLQVSDSIKVVYDSNLQGANPEEKVPGKRVLSIHIRNQAGKFVPISRTDKTTFNMVTNDFLAAGGDGYTMLAGKPVEQGPSMDEAFLAYLKGLSTKELEKYQVALPYTRIISKDSGLVVQLNTKPLKEAIAHAEGLTSADYTQHSWKALTAKLALAQDLLQQGTETEEVSQADLDNMVAQLNEVTLVSVVALREAVASTSHLRAKDYTTSSWQQFMTALNRSTQLLYDAKDESIAISQQALDTVVTQLSDAKQGLVSVTKETPTPTPTPKPGQPKPDKKPQTNKQTLPKTGEERSLVALVGMGVVLTSSYGWFWLKKKQEKAS